MPKLLITFFILIFISSCTSKQVADSGCGFVVGSHEAEQERKQKNSRSGQKHEKSDSDIINGLLSALFGADGCT
ncbi:hypothetical protein [Colwellia echini]|uniref:Lipoprotein n=1 Tax=Colwellia echini TaxID=1982103 RepID=A0ABY3MSZ7_9GAMM|nr:hypothetical protein [Colwellia echini]TYK64320.1 hypothetical protein CWS31_016245 [Colwellia echini]